MQREKLLEAIRLNDAERRAQNAVFLQHAQVLHAQLDALPAEASELAAPSELELERVAIAPELELEPVAPVNALEALDAIAKLDREDDVYALVRKWAKQGNVEALGAVATHSTHSPLVAHVERLLATISKAETSAETAE